MEQFNPVDILIVEDNPADSELMIRALKKDHLANNIFLAEDGEEALDFIFCRGIYQGRQMTAPPKVVFLDLKLPKKNGLEVLEQIRAQESTRRIPVVVVSSSREDPDIEKAYALGANAYVVKPVNFDDFLTAMRQTGFFWMVVNEAPSP
jgi:two-component system response regulator